MHSWGRVGGWGGRQSHSGKSWGASGRSGALGLRGLLNSHHILDCSYFGIMLCCPVNLCALARVMG